MVTVISRCALDVHCYFLVCSGWSLLFPGVPWMVTVISWCALDGHCYFLVCSGWSLLFPGMLWMVTVISWCALDGHCYFLVCSEWSPLFPASCTSKTGHTYKHKAKHGNCTEKNTLCAGAPARLQPQLTTNLRRVLQRGDVQGLGEPAQVAKPRWCIAVPGHHRCCRLADMVQENVAAIHRLPEG